jgi:hypothetical protein
VDREDDKQDEDRAMPAHSPCTGGLAVLRHFAVGAISMRSSATL